MRHALIVMTLVKQFASQIHVRLREMPTGAIFT